MEYRTFDLMISATDTRHEYQLHARATKHGEAHARTTIDTGAKSFLDWHAHLNARHLFPLNQLPVGRNSPNSGLSELQTLGAKLYGALFVGDIGALFNLALGETIVKDEYGVRLRLRIQPPELAVLPWELLYSPERHVFLSTWLETPISHYLDLLEPARSISCPHKLNILVVIPKYSGLETAAEYGVLEKLEIKLAGKINVDFLPGPATGAEIRAALRNKKYHIFHYAGHGSFENENAFLYLDHEEGAGTQIRMAADEFAQFFSDSTSMRLVMLNSCQGAARSSHQALIGTAPQLLVAGVPAVVAMQFVVSNEDAILFAAEFYETLCRENGQVEMALTAARKALYMERPASPAFCNPVLYLRSEAGNLWEPRRWPQNVGQFRTNKFIRLAATFVLILASLVWWFLNSHGESISIAVLDFENETQDPALGGILADLLITDLAQNPNVKTLNKTRILELCHELGLKRVDLALGLSLCQQESIQVLVSGKVVQRGEAYRIEANIFDAKSRKPMFAQRVQNFGANDIFAMVDELSKQIKTKLNVKEAGHDRRIAEQTTNSLEAYKLFVAGQSFYYNGNPIQAIREASQAVALDSMFVDASRALAIWYDAIGGSANALKAARYAKMRSRGRDETDYLQSLIVECQVQRNWDHTIEYLNRYLALRPNDVNKRLQLGYVFSRGKKAFDKAIEQFNEVIRRDPENRSDRLAPAYNHLGLAYLYSGKFDSAMDALKKYQAHAPNNPDPLHSLANALSFHGDYEAAVRQYRQVIQDYPHYYKAYDELGATYLAMGKWRDAQKVFAEYLRLAPQSMWPRGHVQLGRVYFIQGNATVAEKELQAALALDAQNFQAHWLRGLNALLVSGWPDTARQELQRMEKLLALPRARDEAAYYHHLRGRILVAEGKFDEGLSALHKAVEASPREFIYFKKDLAKGYLNAGQPEETIREASELLSFNANAADVLKLLGEAQKRLGRPDRAMQSFRKSDSCWRGADHDFYPLQRLRPLLKNVSYVEARKQPL
jgi:tetratricopeptide (TPR) repeat protein